MSRAGLYRAMSVVALVSVGCARTQAAAPSTVAQGPVDGEAQGAVSPALRARLAEMTEALARRGVRFQAVFGSGFVSHGAPVTTPIAVAAGRCVSVVALASGGVRDLDAHLYDPNGELVVEDVETDAHPTVQLCASENRTLYHVLEAYEGQGVYAVAGFETDRAGLDAVGQVLGGRPGTAGGGVAARSDLERRMNEFRDGLAQRGFQGAGDPGSVTFDAPGTMRLPFAVTPDRCYTLAGFADGPLGDLDLVVVDAAGDELVRDVSPARDAFVQLCPRVATTLSVEVRAAAGTGRAVVLGYAADAASAGANTLWLGERLDGAVSSMPLDEATRIVDARLAGQQFVSPAGLDARLPFAPGQVRELPLRLSAGRCAAVTAVGGPGVGRIQLDVLQDTAWVARAATQGVGSAARVCVADAATLRVRVAPEAGSGEVRVRAHLATAPYLPQGGARREGAPADALSLPEGAWEAGEALAMRATQGVPNTVESERPAGRCVRWSLTADAPQQRLVLTARDADGRSLGRSEGDGVVTLARCGAALERLRVEALAVHGQGEVSLRLNTFSRADGGPARR